MSLSNSRRAAVVTAYRKKGLEIYECPITVVTDERSEFLLLLIVGAIATFTTELMSNTVIQIAMFVSLFPLTKVYPDIGWQTMLVITLTSGCAFMSPIATPSNGLGFGCVKKISLRHMLAAGLLMNIFSLLAITSWVNYVVPVVLSWFA
jgi:sodium-dependent dicarboxylate transporter 2/3/5